jgi:lysophospholipase L1-like esterase
VATGRIDWRQPLAPVVIWQGSEFRLRFQGQRFGLAFSNVRGQNCFTVLVDDQLSYLGLPPAPAGTPAGGEAGVQTWVWDLPLDPGEHEICLIKRSEAFASQVRFQGFVLEPDAMVLPAPERPRLTIEFFGDSITAGACNEDQGEDQYDDHSSHNNWLSYGAITARNLGAAQISTAVSGIGVCASWDPRTMPEIWDRLYVDPSGPAWDFSGPAPDLVVINLGQNDFGFTRHQWQAFPPDFTERYVDLVLAIRQRYPAARLYCVLGGMRCYQESPELRRAWDQAVATLMANDSRLHRYVFSAWAPSHPRTDVHARMAQELTRLIIDTAFRAL